MNDMQLEVLRQGAEIWNKWREENPSASVDLNNALLDELDLDDINLYAANLRGTSFLGASLKRADLSKADLTGANFDRANLSNASFFRSTASMTSFKKARLKEAILTEVNFNKSDFSDSNLSFAQFVKSEIMEAQFNGADLEGSDFTWANLRGSTLTARNFRRSNFHGANLQEIDFSQRNLSEINLSAVNLERICLRNANLFGANLEEANLNNADLSNAILKNANLARIQALGTNFSRATLTGACIENWNISAETKLDFTKCEYIYLELPHEERRPSNLNRYFSPGEFTKLFQKAFNTVDLIFRNGIDWAILLTSLQELKIQCGDAEIAVQSIESKGNENFVVRVGVPLGFDKGSIEEFIRQKYELQIKAQEERLQLRGEQVEFYRDQVELERRQNTKLLGVVEKMAESEKSTYDLRGAKFGGGFAAEGGFQAGGNIIDVSSSDDLASAAQKIQNLLHQISNQNQETSVEDAQQKVAGDLAKQAKDNPTMMGKLVQWGKSLGDAASKTTVSEAAKVVVKLALQMSGIPMP